MVGGLSQDQAEVEMEDTCPARDFVFDQDRRCCGLDWRELEGQYPLSDLLILHWLHPPGSKEAQLMQPKGVSTRGWERDYVRAWAGADQEKHRHMIINGVDGEKPLRQISMWRNTQNILEYTRFTEIPGIQPQFDKGVAL